MTQVISAIVLFAVFGGMLYYVYKTVLQKTKKRNGFYRELAQRLNLKMIENPHYVTMPYMHGQWHDHKVEVFEKVVGQGKNRTVYTDIIFYDTPHDFRFRIGKEGVFSKMGKLVGFKDIEFDDSELDKTFLLKSKNEEGFRAIMDYKALHELMGLKDSLRGFIFNGNGTLSYRMTAVVSSEKRMNELEKVFRFMGLLMDKRDQSQKLGRNLQ